MFGWFKSERRERQKKVRQDRQHLEERARRFLKSYFVRRAAPILKRLVVESDDVVRKVIAHFGWKASVVRESRRPTKNPRC